MPGPVIQGLEVSVPRTLLPENLVIQGLSVKAALLTSVGAVQSTTGYVTIVDVSGFTQTATAGELFERTPNTSNRLFPTGSRRSFPHT